MDIRRSLSQHSGPRKSPLELARRLAEYLTPETRPEDPVRELEERVADLLGKPGALFFPSGTMAQQAALRVHAERTGRQTFAGHPQTHLHVWENQGYNAVHGLRFHPVGDRNELFGLDDLVAVREPLAAVVFELPQRDIGGVLPEFTSLAAQVKWVRESGAAAHCDGARLWEAQTGYDATLAEIAALFDTVYVSLYKGLEGVRGAVLAGDAETIGHAAGNLLEETGIRLFLYARSNPDPRRCSFEVSVGISGLEFTPGEVVELIRGLPSRV